ncbi:MAG: glycerophosphodiester phosphodiesterase [Gammaproteobacteria bacterium]|nr:glycerophosphodiester phosphodiesterase [Gammaproteobacteria bacterium]
MTVAWLVAEGVASQETRVDLGPRPYFLIEDMDSGELKNTLMQCAGGPMRRSEFSIGHRGAPLQFPEHTRESYEAAARMGAGTIECDVTFTSDQALVCRHSQCDLHTTTNILAIPELAAKCSVPFTPADRRTGLQAQAKCCTSDVTLEEFRSLRGRMDTHDPWAETIEAYLGEPPSWQTYLNATRGTLLTHAESIELFVALGVNMTPELKRAEVAMPYDGLTQEGYAQKLIEEYKAAGVSPERVYPQSFDLADVRYWIENEPAFGRQAVFLDDRDLGDTFDPDRPATWTPTMDELVDAGVQTLAPPIWMLLSRDRGGRIVPSSYARSATAAGLALVAWTLERSGTLVDGGGWYYQTVSESIDNSGDMLTVLDVLGRDVGVRAVFSDWAATTTYYANCMGLGLSSIATDPAGSRAVDN